MDKLPLQSKKFIAYLISDVGWKLTLAAILMSVHDKYDQYTFMLLMTLIVVNGFIQVGYILGEIALDRYSRLAEAGLSHKRKQNARTVQPPDQKP